MIATDHFTEAKSRSLNMRVEENWYALKVKFKCEKICHQLLKERGVKSFLPLRKKIRKYGKRIRHSELPLISNFVFVCLSYEDMKKVYDVPYVFDFLRIGKEIARVKQEEIDLLKRLVGQEIDDPQPIGTHLSVGDNVRIISGELTGIEGKIIEIRNNKKLLVQLGSLGFEFIVEIPRTSIYQ